MPAPIGELTGPRSLENAKDWMRDRLVKRIHPLGLTDPNTTMDTIDALEGLDGENWAKAWIAAGHGYMRKAEELISTGDTTAARDA